MIIKILILVLSLCAFGILIYGLMNPGKDINHVGVMSPFVFLILVLISKLKQKQDDKKPFDNSVESRED